MMKKQLAFAAISAIFLTAAAPANGPIPDFSSDGIVWLMRGGTDFTAVPGAPPPNWENPAYPYVGANPDGKQSTYRIADLSNPNLQQWVKDVMKKDNDEVLAGKIAFLPRQSCLPAGVPVFLVYGGGSLHFLQTPKEVIIIFDGDQQVRHVYMDVPHSQNPKPSWYGESVGHYEGDTLVIDTIGQSTKTIADLYRTPHTDKLHVVERWRKVDNGRQLEVAVTVDDPGTYKQPWQATARYQGGKRPYSEEVCAENNNVLFDYGTPTAKTPDF